MNRFGRTLLLAGVSLFLVVTTGGAALPTIGGDQAVRKPLVTRNFKLVSPPAGYKHMEVSRDEETGVSVTRDHKPTVVPVDEKAGLYDLTWIGNDERLKAMRYQVSDRLSLVVEATVTRVAENVFDYRYIVTSLPESAQRLRIFTVQSFSPTALGVKREGLLVAAMAPDLREFNDGTWPAFGVLPSGRQQVDPGMSIEFRVRASAGPGLVGCRAAGGESGMVGVGEDPPSELMNLLPGYEAWPKGNTLGPDERVSELKPHERRAYWREHLDELLELGWMSPSAHTWYNSNLEYVTPSVLMAKTRELYRRNAVTSEIVFIVESF